MNEIIKRNQTEVSIAQDDPFLAYADSVAQSNIVGKLLKFSKGDWMAGQDNEEVPDGTKFVINIDELLVGWQRWEDSKPVDQRMGRVIDRFQKPTRQSLGYLDRSEWELDAGGKPRDPWVLTNYILFKGVHDNELYTFSTSSGGGLDAVAVFLKAAIPQKIAHPNEWPVVAIGGTSYLHSDRSIGRVKKPTFKIVGWAPKNVFQSVAEAVQPDDDTDADVDEFPEVVPPRPPAKKNRI